jgi:tetratricopeptide (TPR) repeat protein
MHFADARFGWREERDTAVHKAEEYIERALAIDAENPDAHRAVAGLLLMRSEFAAAVVAARRAVELAPNLSDVLMFASFVLQCSGHFAEAVALIERAIALSPKYPPNYLGQLGNAYRLSGRIDEALAAFRSYNARSSGFGLADGDAARAGRCLDEARAAARQLLAERPGFTVSAWIRTQMRCDTEQLTADIASLRAVGLPE